MDSRKSILLLSGGLDSGALLYSSLHQGIEILPLFVNYGQVTFPGEWFSVRSLLESTKLPPIKPLDVQNISTFGAGTLIQSKEKILPIDQYFPSRNLFLITLAAMYAYQIKVSSILIGLIADTANSLPDCSPDFLLHINDTLQLEYPELQVTAPYITRSKLDTVREAMNYGFIPENTFCCNRFSDHHCGKCPSCIDRFNILAKLNRY